MKHKANPTSPLVLSLNIYWPLHSLIKFIMMNNFLIQFMLLLPSLIWMLPPSIKKIILKSNIFMCLLKILIMKNKWQMELIFLLMMIHSHIHFYVCLLSYILRSMFQILHTLCIPLSLMVHNSVIPWMFSYPDQVLCVS